MLRHQRSRWAIAYLFGTITLSFFIHLVSANVLFEDEPEPQKLRLEFSRLPVSGMVQKDEVRTRVPIIGVLTQVLRDYKRFTNTHHLHLASSYVKWIESAGAQVVPILLNQDDAYYEKVFKQTNGLLFPGGDNLLDPKKATPMMTAARKLYKLAVDANDRGDYYPIWGTCLGLELMSVLSSGKNELDKCDATDTLLPLDFVERGKLFEANKNANLKVLAELDYAKLIMDTMRKMPVTYNYHQKCLTDEGLARAGLQNFYKPLAYSTDSSDNKFIAIFEAREYPFYGVQFHPEKPAFEFTQGKDHRNVPHSRESIEVSRYLADFFVRQAQLNGHKAHDQNLIDHQLIYASNPLYTGAKGDLYEQRYLFPFTSSNIKSRVELLRECPQGAEWVKVDGIEVPRGVSPYRNIHLVSEFLEHVPKEGEVVPEDV